MLIIPIIPRLHAIELKMSSMNVVSTIQVQDIRWFIQLKIFKDQKLLLVRFSCSFIACSKYNELINISFEGWSFYVIRDPLPMENISLHHKHQSLNQTRGTCLLFVHNISRTQALVVFIQLIERKQQHSNSGGFIHISNEKYWHDFGYYLRKWTIDLSVIHPCASRWNQQRVIKQRTTIILWQEGTSS